MKVPGFLRSYRRRRQLIWGGLGVVVIVSALDHAGVFGFEGSDRERYGFKDAVVLRAVDSNTMEVDLVDGSEPHTRVRLWGVECPTADLYFGPESAEYIRRSFVGKRVRVILDPNHRVRDREGRLLAYLYLVDSGEQINGKLVDLGLAYADWRFEHVMKHSFSEHEKKAAKAKAGLWAKVTPEQMPEWRQRMDAAQSK